ncbi:MAG: VOC family protein [Firmicutes bacterium]|jgi:lactoylglutathione lyase|nr:VOC family protein [Bacillota bacterium]
MKIEHIAIWSPDIDRLRDFYIKYFNAKANKKYENKKTGFSSYFLEFEGASRLEIMNISNLSSSKNLEDRQYGYCHLAIAVGTMFRVMKLTKLLYEDGYEVVSQPRMTGDGYIESVILDPDGNRIEITK